MREYAAFQEESQEQVFKRLKKLMETPPKADRNRVPPKCPCCPFYQPGFKYRRCLYAACPYGKDKNTSFRRKPLPRQAERLAMGGGGMRV